MTPLEVVIVTPKPSTATLIGRCIGSLIVMPLFAGWALMLLVPLAARSFGTPHALPSYWQSVGVLVLLRLSLAVFRTASYPVLTDKRKS